MTNKVASDAYSISVNNYSNCALITSGRLILVDTGVEPDAKELISKIKSCGYQPRDIEVIIITHTHLDHVRGLSVMKQVSDAIVAAHEIEAKYISQQEMYYRYSEMKDPFDAVLVNDLLTDGQFYNGFRVIHTPGHTPGNIALLDEETGLLIAGDSFRTEDERILPIWDQYNHDSDEHMYSIQKLSGYNFNSVIVGHGDPIHNAARDRFDPSVLKD